MLVRTLVIIKTIGVITLDALQLEKSGITCSLDRGGQHHVLCATAASGQEYPTHTVRWVLPFSAGGALDIVARVVTQKVSESLKMQMLVENRTGAGGIIGSELVAKAAPDGYVNLVCNLTNATYPALYKKRTYEPLGDFRPITLAASFAFILSVHPSLPVNSVSELIQLAKLKPGSIVYGSSGIGSPPHFATEMMSVMKRIKMIHVPYAGNPQAQQDLMSGQTQVLFINTANALALIKVGRVHGLAISSLKRSSLAPEYPTVAESGLPGFEVLSWVGFCSPAKTPNAIVQKLNAEFMKALALPEVAQRLQVQGFEVTPLPLEKFHAYFKSEIEKYEKIAAEAKIEPQ